MVSRAWKSPPATGGSSSWPKTVRNPRWPFSDSTGTAIAEHDRRLHDPYRVVVRDPHGAHPAAVRRAADRSGASRVPSPGGEAGGSRDRSAVDPESDGRPGDAVDRRGRFGAAGEHLVEVECLPERLDDARADGILAHLLDGRRQLVGECVHLSADAEKHVVEPSVRRAPRAEHHRGGDARSDECRDRGDECEGAGAHGLLVSPTRGVRVRRHRFAADPCRCAWPLSDALRRARAATRPYRRPGARRGRSTSSPEASRCRAAASRSRSGVARRGARRARSWFPAGSGRTRPRRRNS